MRRVWGWLVKAGTLVIAIVAVFVLVPAVLGYARYVIESGSMDPAIPKGSVVYSKPAPAEALKVGEVISYEPPPEFHIDSVVTHRIFKIEPLQQRPDAGTQEPAPAVPRLIFTTKGDANEAPDPWRFELDDGAAREEANVPYVGYVYLALAKPEVLYAVVALLVLLLLLIVISFWRSAGEEAEEERARIERARKEREVGV